MEHSRPQPDPGHRSGISALTNGRLCVPAIWSQIDLVAIKHNSTRSVAGQALATPHMVRIQRLRWGKEIPQTSWRPKYCVPIATVMLLRGQGARGGDHPCDPRAIAHRRRGREGTELPVG
jgi:hypothetical protein